MQRKLRRSMSLLWMVVALIGCSGQSTSTSTPATPSESPLTPTANLVATSTPTQVPCDVDPAVNLTSSAESIKVGQTLTLTAQVTDVGMPQLALSLSSGASVRYSGGKPQLTDDSIFEIVSVEASGFVLRGKAVGEADATVSANGEVGCFNTGYSWGNAVSAPLHIAVTP